MEMLKIALVGIGGFAEQYVSALLDHPKRENLRVVGAVDPYAEQSAAYPRLKALGVPFYDTIDGFYAEHTADLTIICTPIQFHAEQSVYAMEKGSHVLLEKPIAPTVADGKRILLARDTTGKRLAIGYQWCYDPAMLRLKKDVESGVYGKALRMKTLVLWPRGFSYYGRGTGWAGKQYDAAGRAIFDNILSNATAHFLANMLWMDGPGFHGAEISGLQVETARANQIETFDTAVLKARTQSGASLFMAVSHAIDACEEQDIMFEYTFEKGVVHFGGYGKRHGPIVGKLQDRDPLSYGESNPSNMDKLWAAVDMAREGKPPACPGEMALRHAKAMEGVRTQSGSPFVFPKERIVTTEERVFVPGLRDALVACYEAEKLPSQLPDPWGK